MENKKQKIIQSIKRLSNEQIAEIAKTFSMDKELFTSNGIEILLDTLDEDDMNIIMEYTENLILNMPPICEQNINPPNIEITDTSYLPSEIVYYGGDFKVQEGLLFNQIKKLLDEAAEEPIMAGTGNIASQMFDKILLFYPEAMDLFGNGYYYYCRGLGKSFNQDYLGAINDFDRAIELEKQSIDHSNWDVATFLFERGYANYRLNYLFEASADMIEGANLSHENFNSWMEFIELSDPFFNHVFELFHGNDQLIYCEKVFGKSK